MYGVTGSGTTVICTLPETDHSPDRSLPTAFLRLAEANPEEYCGGTPTWLLSGSGLTMPRLGPVPPMVFHSPPVRRDRASVAVTPTNFMALVITVPERGDMSASAPMTFPPFCSAACRMESKMPPPQEKMTSTPLLYQRSAVA